LLPLITDMPPKLFPHSERIYRQGMWRDSSRQTKA